MFKNFDERLLLEDIMKVPMFRESSTLICVGNAHSKFIDKYHSALKKLCPNIKEIDNYNVLNKVNNTIMNRRNNQKFYFRSIFNNEPESEIVKPYYFYLNLYNLDKNSSFQHMLEDILKSEPSQYGVFITVITRELSEEYNDCFDNIILYDKGKFGNVSCKHMQYKGICHKYIYDEMLTKDKIFYLF